MNGWPCCWVQSPKAGRAVISPEESVTHNGARRGSSRKLGGMNKPRPFWPPERERDGTLLVRAAAALALAYLGSTDRRAYLGDAHVERIIKQRWAADREIEAFVKAAVSQTTLAS